MREPEEINTTPRTMLKTLALTSLVMALLMLACGSSAQLVANAGVNTSITVGSAPHFNGCESAGEIANYQWAIVETPPANQHDRDKVIRATDTGCSFTLEADMQVNEIGTWIIELTITDDKGARDTDQVTVTVIN